MGRRYRTVGQTTRPLVGISRVQVPGLVLWGNHLAFLTTDNISHLIICFNIKTCLQKIVTSTFVEGNVAISIKISMHFLFVPVASVLGIFLKYILYDAQVVTYRIIVKWKKTRQEKVCLICYHLFKKGRMNAKIYMYLLIFWKDNKRIKHKIKFKGLIGRGRNEVEGTGILNIPCFVDLLWNM